MNRTTHQVTRQAIDWLAGSREHCVFPADTAAALADPNGAYKPLGEMALAASLVLREGVAGPAEALAARGLLEHAWQQLGAGALLYERQLRYPLMTDPLELYAHFARSGYRHPPLEELLTQLARLRSTRAAELVPNRRLAVANAARIVGLPIEVNWAALAATTWLGACPEPWAIDWMTAYHVTHTVFHLTDWGADPGGLPRYLHSYLRRWLPVWLEVWGEVGEWDLVAELLIVNACLDEPGELAEDWTRLAGAQRADGLLPRDAQPVAADPAQAARDHHHPTVVAVVAGTLTLSRSLGSPVGR